MASMLLDQQEHFWEVRGHGHTLDQSLIFCICHIFYIDMFRQRVTIQVQVLLGVV